MALSKDVRFSPRGLWLASAAIEAPKGGLLAAENCVLRRAGLLEPRPGLPKTAVFTYDTHPNSSKLIPGPGDTYLSADKAASTDNHRLRWNNLTAVNLPNDSNDQLEFPDRYARGQRAQGNVYLTTKDDLRKVDEDGGAVAYQATPPTPAVIVTGEGSGVAVESGMYVAYRVVTRRKDSAGLVARSAPSGRALFLAASDSQVSLTLLLHRGATAIGASYDQLYTTFLSGDVIEVYRTVNETTNPPTDTMYLVGEIELDSADVTAGYVAVTDNVPDLEIGQALYTNEGQGGAEAANNRPPAAKSLALFNGSLFLGNVKYPATAELAYTALLTSFATTQIGVHVAGGSGSVSFTNGSAVVQVLGLSNIKPGMIIAASSPNWADTGYVYVVSLDDPTHITVSSTWQGSTGGSTASFLDSIKISDGQFTGYYPVATVRDFMQSLRSVDVHTPLTEGTPAGPFSMVTVDIVDDDTSAITIYDYARKRFQVTALRGGSSLEIWATNGDQWSPVLPEPTVVSGKTFAPEEIVNGLAWSNNREPSHFPDTNFEHIGADDEPILALHAIKNALIVFKKDGAFRVSGSGAESGFRVDELDKNVRLVSPDAACELGDKVYAWADTGVYEVDENGTENISDVTLSEVLHPIEVKIGVGNTAAPGAWMCANRREDEILLSVPAQSDLTVGERLYVWNKSQRGWTTWLSSGALRHGISRASGLAISDGTSIRLEQDPNGTGYVPFLDEATSVTISDVSDLNVTINAGSGWTPTVGDVILRGAVYARVTAVTDTTHFAVDLAVTTGAASAYSAYTCTITPIASTGGDPSALKMWGEGSVVWDSLKGLTAYTLSVTSALSDTAVTSARSVATTPATTKRAEAFRFRTPDRHARTTRLYPSVVIRQAGADWAFSAVALSYRPMSSRVRTR